jgi:hypothetical protein
MRRVVFEVQGGGASSCGAGGASGTSVSVAAPGTSGSYAKGIFTTAQVSTSQAVTIGAGGAANANATGFNGGTSSVGSLIIAPGGIAPSTLTNAPPPTVSANGANSSNPTGGNIFSSVGSASSPSIAFSESIAVGGAGGASLFGPGAPSPQINTNGTSATNHGAGGSGCIVNMSGGTATGGGGGGGIVIIYEYS